MLIEKNDRLTDSRIEALNAQEQSYELDFFKHFIKSITVYEDDDIWVGNKPFGLLSVDGRTLKASLQSRLVKVYPNIKLVHRLDMDTSGLIVFAKNAAAQTHLSKEFIARTPKKEYQALVFGTPPQTGVIDVPVRYDPATKPRHIVDLAWHKNALTHYTVLHHELRTHAGTPYAVSRLALHPITGRSHQLRVHCVHIGCVMLGDPIYATGTALVLADRLCLHAHKLRIRHPNGAWCEWVSEVPF